MSRIHDNEILSYEVDLKRQKIIIRTECHDATIIKNIDIVFSDVIAHLFETQLKGSIIFDIKKYELIQFIENNNELLKKQKNYCWPMDYDTVEELAERLLNEQYSYYVLSASYGLSGWVVAKNYEILLVE